MAHTINKSNDEWRALLGDEAYSVLREKGTERAFAGKLWDHHEDGTYTCAGCGHRLFESKAKFDSGTGWPSFFEPTSDESVTLQPDTEHGMDRTEVVCHQCGGHLGHVFSDGPPPTQQRFCINSISLKFRKD